METTDNHRSVSLTLARSLSNPRRNYDPRINGPVYYIPVPVVRWIAGNRTDLARSDFSSDVEFPKSLPLVFYIHMLIDPRDVRAGR